VIIQGHPCSIYVIAYKHIYVLPGIVKYIMNYFLKMISSALVKLIEHVLEKHKAYISNFSKATNENFNNSQLLKRTRILNVSVKFAHAVCKNLIVCSIRIRFLRHLNDTKSQIWMENIESRKEKMLNDDAQ